MADETRYPTDRQHRSRSGKGIWALQVIRALQKTGAANHIGRDAAWLITTIAALEDTKRYTGEVGFWNGHLMDATGFGSKQSFLNARARAVKAGWLVYVEGRKGVSAKYWTAIPEEAVQFIDSTILDEDAGPNPDQQTENAGPNPDHKPDQKGKCRSGSGPQTGPESGPESGPHSYLSPLPIPKTEGAALPKHSKPKFQKPTSDQVMTYAVELNQHGFDAEKFCDYYEANGWRAGRNAMKDWKATVRNWIRNGGTTNGKASGSPEAETAWQTVLDSLQRRSRFKPDEIRADIGERAWPVVKAIGLKQIDEAKELDRRELKAKFIRAFTEQRGAA